MTPPATRRILQTAEDWAVALCHTEEALAEAQADPRHDLSRLESQYLECARVLVAEQGGSNESVRLGKSILGSLSLYSDDAKTVAAARAMRQEVEEATARSDQYSDYFALGGGMAAIALGAWRGGALGMMAGAALMVGLFCLSEKTKYGVIVGDLFDYRASVPREAPQANP